MILIKNFIIFALKLLDKSNSIGLFLSIKINLIQLIFNKAIVEIILAKF